MAGQNLERGELTRGQIQPHAIERGTACGRIDQQRIGAAVGAPHQRTQTRCQLVQMHRLDDLVIGAASQSRDTVNQRCARGHQQYRRGVAATAPAGNNHGAAAARQISVDHGSRTGAIDQRSCCMQAILDPVHRIAQMPKTVGQCLAQWRNRPRQSGCACGQPGQSPQRLPGSGARGCEESRAPGRCGASTVASLSGRLRPCSIEAIRFSR